MRSLIGSEGEIAAGLNGRPAGSEAARSAGGDSAADAAEGDAAPATAELAPASVMPDEVRPVEDTVTEANRVTLPLHVLDPAAGAELQRGLSGAADFGRIVVGWARGRSIGSSSAGGISLALALCAAGWFSSGTRADNFKAVVALGAAYLAMLTARSLASLPPAGFRQARGTLQVAGRTIARARWLAVLGWAVAECACYAGLAAGATADRWGGMWTLTIAVLGLIAVRDLMAACAGSGYAGSAWTDPAEDGPVRRAVGMFLTMPPGGRVLLIGVVAPIWGGRAAVFALLDWAIIAVGYGLAGQPGSVSERPAPSAARPDDPAPPWPGSLVLLLSPSGQELTDVPRAGGPGPPVGSGLDVAAGVAPFEQKPPPAAQPQPPDPQVIVHLRDDGVLSRRIGQLVRGNLLPLPPAALGLAATVTLALLGWRNLPAILVLAPVLIMLLVAAPGSSNRHAGRFDWLVPAVLLGWQFLYLSMVAIAAAIPGLVALALGAAVVIRYADLACPGRPVILTRPLLAGDAPRERGRALGWEGRMLLLGFGAALGIGTFTCLALTAYLCLLICSKVLTSWLGLRDGAVH